MLANCIIGANHVNEFGQPAIKSANVLGHLLILLA